MAQYTNACAAVGVAFELPNPKPEITTVPLELGELRGLAYDRATCGPVRFGVHKGKGVTQWFRCEFLEQRLT